MLKVQRSNKWLEVELYFPTTYPVDVAPVVTVLHSNLDTETQSRVVKVLYLAADKIWILFVFYDESTLA